MHVVVIYDADGVASLTLCRDGESLGSMPTRLRLADVADQHHRIGPFSGRFDELRIHGRALTAEEARGSHRAGPDAVDVVEGRGRR